jgi:hypothetical protein
MFRAYPLVLLGCASPALDSAGVESSRGEGGTAWEWTDPRGTPTFDAEVYTADLQLVVDTLPSYRPGPLLESYAAARTLGEGSCPAEDSLTEAGITNTWWYGACTSAHRVHFNGVMTAWGWDGIDLAPLRVTDLGSLVPDGFLWWGNGFEGRIDIFDEADTADFSCSCEAVTATGQASDGRAVYLDYARGPASWTGPEADGTWLEQTTVRASLALWAESDPRGEAWTLHVEADESGMGERYRSVKLQYDIKLTPDRLGCTEVAGSIRVRDATTATWAEVTAEKGEGAPCNACVEVEGQTVCTDLTPLLMEATSRWW